MEKLSNLIRACVGPIGFYYINSTTSRARYKLWPFAELLLLPCIFEDVYSIGPRLKLVYMLSLVEGIDSELVHQTDQHFCNECSAFCH